MTTKLGLINDVQLRFLCPEDVEDVKLLCREWFPIDYPDLWFNEITSNPKFFSLAATYNKSIIGLLIAEVKSKFKTNKELCKEKLEVDNLPGAARVKLKHKDSGILGCSYNDDAQVAYVLSIGVVKEYRRQGIASLLLDNLLSHLTTPERHQCKAVYLHVLTSNTAAVQFYKSRRFQQFEYLPMYYAINGVHRDGFSFVLYINGGEPPWTLGDAIRHAGTWITRTRPCKLPIYLMGCVYRWLLWFMPVQTISDSCVRNM